MNMLYNLCITYHVGDELIVAVGVSVGFHFNDRHCDRTVYMYLNCFDSDWNWSVRSPSPSTSSTSIQRKSK